MKMLHGLSGTEQHVELCLDDLKAVLVLQV